MNENRFQSSKRQKPAKKLVADLIQLNSAGESGTIEDEEMLSLIIEEACQGIDISKRYPTFYQKLLKHPDLRQTFLDVLDSIEDEEQNTRIPWANETGVDLGFLTEQSLQPVIKKLPDHWSVSWQRTIDHLQAIFSPSELVYRSDPTLSEAEDPWFILLREEIEIEDLLYAIVLECTFSEENEEALSPVLNVAVTIGATAKQPSFPVQTSIHWGKYNEILQISQEGRARFPDIPFETIFDEEQNSIKSELRLTLQSPT